MKIGVFIGRFQPVTNSHAEIIKESLKKYDKLIVIIGSSNSTTSLRNPFSDIVRHSMILTFDIENIIVEFVKDSNYNFLQWLADVQKIILNNVKSNDEIFIIGHFKDSGSYWLNHFPQWKLDDPGNKGYPCGTSVRKLFFNNGDWQSLVPQSIVDIMTEWKVQNEKIFTELCKEFKFIENYKDQWKKAPYTPTFVTVDALVVCKGNVLLIKRGRNPGKNLYAMPGGFINEFEFLKDACLRELKEETKIDVDKTILENSIKQIKVIDNPYRDERGRIITHVYLIELNLKNLPNIKAADDASEVKWISLGEIDLLQNKFYSDHYQILKSLI